MNEQQVREIVRDELSRFDDRKQYFNEVVYPAVVNRPHVAQERRYDTRGTRAEIRRRYKSGVALARIRQEMGLDMTMGKMQSIVGLKGATLKSRR